MSGNEFAVAIQSGYKQGYEDGGIKELEKIKSEIEQMDFDFGNYYDNTDTIIEMVSNVIDKHIAELKGE